jgi:hypothetical protein
MPVSSYEAIAVPCTNSEAERKVDDEGEAQICYRRRTQVEGVRSKASRVAKSQVLSPRRLDIMTAEGSADLRFSRG